MKIDKVSISTEYIKLDQFLKWCGIATTGGIAKELIENSEVKVNGNIELRRGKKIRSGDKIEVLGKTFLVLNSGEEIGS